MGTWLTYGGVTIQSGFVNESPLPIDFEVGVAVGFVLSSTLE